MKKVTQPAPGTDIADRSDGAVLVMDEPRDGWPRAHVRLADGTEHAPRALAVLIAHGHWELRTLVNLAPDSHYEQT